LRTALQLLHCNLQRAGKIIFERSRYLNFLSGLEVERQERGIRVHRAAAIWLSSQIEAIRVLPSTRTSTSRKNLLSGQEL
jgi:hypothetical protein